MEKALVGLWNVASRSGSNDKTKLTVPNGLDLEDMVEVAQVIEFTVETME